MISASRSGISKLDSYRRLGVPEVWLWERQQIQVYRLTAGDYRRRTQSVCMRGIDLEDLAVRVVNTPRTKQMDSVRSYRKWLRKHLPKRATTE